jgi:hypothetical protein
MDNPFNNLPKTAGSTLSDTFHKELARYRKDLIMVHNITDVDYICYWDGEPHRVPGMNKDMGHGKGNRPLPRYIAEKYVVEMKDKLINEMQDNKLIELKNSLRKRGATDVVYNANDILERSGEFRTNNPTLINDLFDKLWLGVYEEFGVDTEIVGSADGERLDNRPQEQQILEKMNSKRYSAGTAEVAVEPVEVLPKEKTYPINKNKEKFVEEVSQV